MKILHFSDLHMGAKGMEARLQNIVHNAVRSLQPAHEFVVVITGDLVENPFRSGSFEKVQKCLDILRRAGFAVLVAPGNHDYGPGGLMFKRWVSRFQRTFYGEVQGYPRLDILGDIAFFCLDSQAGELNFWHRFWAEGKLGKAQLHRLRELLASPAVQKCDHRVIYMHHHPFDPKPILRLKDSEELKKMLEEFSIDAILFGHNHDARVWNGNWGINRAYDAGTSTGKKSKKCGPHRVMDLKKSPDTDWLADLYTS